MIQRSAGNPTRKGARRRYADDERLELVPDRDDSHVRVIIEETSPQRRRAARTLRSSLLVIGGLLVGIHQPWSFVLGAGCLAAFSEAPWERIERG